jgi:hypothetical protein
MAGAGQDRSATTLQIERLEGRTEKGIEVLQGLQDRRLPCKMENIGTKAGLSQASR